MCCGDRCCPIEIVTYVCFYVSPCLQSVRCKRAAGEKGKAGHAGDTGINWLVFELLWRDFFRFITRKYGAGSGVASNPMQTPALG